MIKVPRDLTYPPKIKHKSRKKQTKKREVRTKKKCAVPEVKYSVTSSDLVTAYVTFVTNDSISAHLIGRKQSHWIEIRKL